MAMSYYTFFTKFLRFNRRGVPVTIRAGSQHIGFRVGNESDEYDNGWAGRVSHFFDHPGVEIAMADGPTYAGKMNSDSIGEFYGIAVDFQTREMFDAAALKLRPTIAIKHSDESWTAFFFFPLPIPAKRLPFQKYLALKLSLAQALGAQTQKRDAWARLTFPNDCVDQSELRYDVNELREVAGNPVKDVFVSIAETGLLPGSAETRRKDRASSQAIYGRLREIPDLRGDSDPVLASLLKELGAKRRPQADMNTWQFPPIEKFRTAVENHYGPVTWRSQPNDWIGAN